MQKKIFTVYAGFQQNYCIQAGLVIFAVVEWFFVCFVRLSFVIGTRKPARGETSGRVFHFQETEWQHALFAREIISKMAGHSKSTPAPIVGSGYVFGAGVNIRKFAG